jgi:hypothetical protein
VRDRSGLPELSIRPLDEGWEEGAGGPRRKIVGLWDDYRLEGVGQNQALRKSLEVLGIHVMHKES